MSNKLFLLDGMALIYRGHFALIRSPVFTSKRENTSALFGFTNTLLELLSNQKPTHMAIVLDTAEPTERHELYEDYKAQREETPEDILMAIPNIERLAEAFSIPVLKCPGHEADDIIGTVAGRAEAKNFETYMVTADKDLGQLVSEKTFFYKPGRKGGDAEVLRVPEIQALWNVQDPTQVADVLGLWGDSSDNIPGVPGYGEKTAKKLIGEYGTLENLLEHVDALKGKQKERLVEHREQAILSKRLATINRDVPIKEKIGDLKIGHLNEKAVKSLFVEFEFNALGKRLLGEDFKAGRGHAARTVTGDATQGEFLLADLKTMDQVEHNYHLVDNPVRRKELIEALSRQSSFCFDVETDGLDPKRNHLAGIAFSYRANSGYYVALSHDPPSALKVLEEFRVLFEDKKIEKVGHNLNFDISILKWHGVDVEGPLFDTMVAHYLIEPEQRHTMDIFAEQYLGYTPRPFSQLIGPTKAEQRSIWAVPIRELAEYAAEDADVTWQLKAILEAELRKHAQEKVFHEIEMPLVRVLTDMSYEGVRLDASALTEISSVLEQSIADLQKRIFDLSQTDFNLNSPKQLGEVLFDKLKLVDKPKKTKTGQYATNEQVLLGLAPHHEIIRLILEYRESSKLKTTYVDTLPEEVCVKTGGVHTRYNQAVAATGRLASSDPNIQNIPIRTEQGRHVRKAFVPRNDDYLLLVADYSQIELRIMAEISGDEALTQAFLDGYDIHSATAARVYGVALEAVDADMRRKAKMVNFGIMYGISAFGLAQRLGVSRKESVALIDEYFKQYPKVKRFMDNIVENAKKTGYTETITGRRRYIRDINSANATTRAAAERIAINAPIQGTAADIIKIAMIRIHRELIQRAFKTKMILQVHDELIFDLYVKEEDVIRPLVEEAMKTAISLTVPVEIHMHTGRNWLEAD